jgi:hypothetical protein
VKTTTTQLILPQDLSAVVSHLQRMASEQAELLKKFHEHEEKQDPHILNVPPRRPKNLPMQ